MGNHDRRSSFYTDDTIRCEKCGVELRYNKIELRWDAVELYPESRRCKIRNTEDYDHIPLMNVGRLFRAARRWNDRRHHVT